MLCRRTRRVILLPRKAASKALAASGQISVPHLRMGRKTLEGAANPQVAGKGAGHEQALQKAHACKSPHAEDRAGSSYNDSGNLRCRADARASAGVIIPELSKDKALSSTSSGLTE